MSILNQLASSQNRRDEVSNQELARDLATKKDKAGIREVVENLWNKDKKISSDWIKVLYEIAKEERVLPAVTSKNKNEFIKVIEKHMEDLSGGGLNRIKKLIKQATDL